MFQARDLDWNPLFPQHPASMARAPAAPGPVPILGATGQGQPVLNVPNVPRVPNIAGLGQDEQVCQHEHLLRQQHPSESSCNSSFLCAFLPGFGISESSVVGSRGWQRVKKGFLAVPNDLQAEIALVGSSGCVTVGIWPGIQQILEVFLLVVFPKKLKLWCFSQRNVVSWLIFGFVLLVDFYQKKRLKETKRG